MGEELDIGSLIMIGPDGKRFQWDGITSAEIVPSEEDKANEPDELYATINRNESLEFSVEATISKEGWLWILLGSKRLVRRALRWYEWLRRMEIKGKFKIGNKLDLAAQCARHKGNNGKRAKKPHIYHYSIRMERED